MIVIIGTLFILPMVGAQLGKDLNVVGWLIGMPVDTVIWAILKLAGNS